MKSAAPQDRSLDGASPSLSGRRVTVVIGASAGLGEAIARRMAEAGDLVMLVGRNEQSLEHAARRIATACGSSDRVLWYAADVAELPQVQRFKQFVEDRAGRLDVLINCVGKSDRGWASELSAEHVQQMVETNLITTIHGVQVFLPMLRESGGSVVNVGSLAGKIGASYLGAYALSKHALSGWTQQLRMECRSMGVHVGLVCPGPIQRDDAGKRYSQQVENSDLPATAAAPAAGAKLRGLRRTDVADAVLDCVKSRKPEVLMPRKVRLLIILSAISPRLGDWLLRKFTSSGDG